MRPAEGTLARWALRLLRPLLPRDWADDIVAELAEAWRRRISGEGGSVGRRRLAADLWLLGQAAGFGLRFGMERAGETTGAVLEGVRQDSRVALRGFRRAPAFLTTVVLTLALGIGANTAIFSVVNAVLLAPLPYPAAERLVTFTPYPWTHLGVLAEVEGTRGSVEEVAAYYPRRFAVTDGPAPEEVEGVRATPDLLPLLGARPVLGRLHRPDDAEPGAAATAVISHSLWERRFGGSPAALGSTLRVDGALHEVVGVLGPGFRQMAPRSDAPEIWLPMSMASRSAAGEVEWGIPIARLRSGVSLDLAREELGVATARYLDRHPEVDDLPRGAPRWIPLGDELAGGVRTALVVLQGAAALVLLLACVNVANLLLVRLTGRMGEVAVRTALGASRGRIFRQLLTESLVLSLLGGMAGLLLMGVCLELVLALAPADVPRIGEAALDGSALLFALGASLATGLVFGIVPGLAVTGGVASGLLARGGRRVAGGSRGRRLSQGLVVAEVTLTLVLLVSAGLLARTFFTLTARDPGFRTEDVLMVRLQTPEDAAGSVHSLERLHEGILAAMAAVPGVVAVGVTNNLPMERGGSSRLYLPEGETEPRSAQYGVVSAGYFEALDGALVAGRLLSGDDRREAPRVAVVDDVFAHANWPAGDAVGRRFRFSEEESWMTVVGVVVGVRGDGPGSDPRPGFYIPYRRRSDTPVELAVGRRAFMLVRSERGAAELAPLLREAVWAAAPDQPVPEIRTLTSVVAAGVAPERFRAALLGAFAAIALFLAVAGVYGVVSHLLAERTHEMGVRRAIGATGTDVVRDVLGWGLKLAVAGVAVGLAAVLVLARWLESLLFGVTGSDPLTLGAAVALVMVVTLVGCAVPARRAARVDPAEALRAE